MRNYKVYISAMAIGAMVLSSVSCKKTFYTDANVNTNQPTVVPPNTLLPSVEVALAYTQGGDASRYASEFIQQGYGAAREATADYDYQISGTNLPEQFWDNMYSSDMNNAYTLLNMAKANGYNAYAGMTSILMAYSLQVTCDFWGSIPYSQAFLGAANINPSYDADNVIYGDIMTLLNTGIADLNMAPGGIVPGADDVIFNGNTASWINFANAIKARVYIHQCKHSNVANVDSAFNCAQRALADGFTTAQVKFPGVPNSNPMYQYNAGWGDISFVDGGGVFPTMYDSMLAISDPRITPSAYFDSTGSATAATPIVGLNPTLGYYSSATSPVEFITPEELYFIEAEATLRGANTGTVAAAAICYNNAITANFTKLGLSGSTAAYLVANALPVTVAAAQHTVAIQEWYALFLNPEAWATWRRTGWPALVAPVGAVSANIPRRMVLPNSETTENSNSPKGETLWAPVLFWDN